MCKTQWVLGLLALYAGLAHSWDIAVSHGNLLEFYTNETKSDSVRFGSQVLGALAYDGVHNIVLYVNKQSGNDAVCGYYITDNRYFCYERHYSKIRGLAFDPVTELLFFSDINSRSINWFSLKPGSKNNVHGNLLIKMDQGIPTDIAVDSCRGSNSFTVSKTYLYWVDWRSEMDTEIYVRKYGKITDTGISKPINLNTASVTVGIAANYEISLTRYLENKCGGSFCVHGTQIIGQLICKCTPGYIGERCDVSVCENYCFQGDCSLNDDGNPKCRCHNGYSGDRCEVNECHGFCLNNGVCSLNEADEPSCKCTGSYEGSRCEAVPNDCNTHA